MPDTRFIVALLIIVPILLSLFERINIETAALLIAFLLGTAQYAGLGVLGPANVPHQAVRAIAGFGQPVIITLVGLFIITGSLTKNGVTSWLAQRINAIGGKSERLAILLLTLTAAVLSLAVTNIAAGALVMPIALHVSRSQQIRPGLLLMPVAFGTLLGGGATYFTTANIIVSDLLTIATPPQSPLTILDFLPTGGLIAIAGIAYLTLLGPYLLPKRTALIEEIGQVSSNTESTTQRTPQAILSVIVTVAAVGLSIAGMPVYLAMLGGAVLILSLRLLDAADIYRVVDWRTVLFVGGMTSASIALTETGLAAQLGGIMLQIAMPFGGLGLAAGCFILTALLVQVIGGQVAVLVTGPIGISAAIQAGISTHAIAVTVAIASSAAFLTPIAHPVNALVMYPAGYRVTDYMKVGAGLTLISFIGVLVGLVLFWRM